MTARILAISAWIAVSRRSSEYHRVRRRRKKLARAPAPAATEKKREGASLASCEEVSGAQLDLTACALGTMASMKAVAVLGVAVMASSLLAAEGRHIARKDLGVGLGGGGAGGLGRWDGHGALALLGEIGRQDGRGMLVLLLCVLGVQRGRRPRAWPHTSREVGGASAAS